jgi:hypothetical protein
MTTLCFSRQEYQALDRVCRRRIDHKPAQAFKKFLVSALADTLPELSCRIDNLSEEEVRVLQEHFLLQHQTEAGHGLTPREVAQVAQVASPVLFHTRFFGSLQRSLIRHFLGECPRLAAALAQLTLPQFESLCAEIQEWIRKKA